MKKKLMALALAAVMTVGSVASVSAATVKCGGTLTSRKVTAYTQVVGGNTADYTATVLVKVYKSNGKWTTYATVGDTGANGSTYASFSYTEPHPSLLTFKAASATHNAFYRGVSLMPGKKSKTVIY